MSPRRRSGGCLQVAALALFAGLVGAFAASTLYRHAPEPTPPPSEPAAAGEAVPALDRARIRVEVRNGSGRAGLAERVTAYLRDAGFDVVDFGNADRFDHAQTTILDRIGRPTLAREVGRALPGVRIASEPDSSLFLDVTVVLGADVADVLERGRRETVEEEPRSGWFWRLLGR